MFEECNSVMTENRRLSKERKWRKATVRKDEERRREKERKRERRKKGRREKGRERNRSSHGSYNSRPAENT